MNRAVLSSLNELYLVIKRKRFWKNVINIKPAINERQKKILSKLLDNFVGKLTSTKYAKICNCSQDTAIRDLQKLVEHNLLEKSEEGGRSTSYTLIF